MSGYVLFMDEVARVSIPAKSLRKELAPFHLGRCHRSMGVESAWSLRRDSSAVIQSGRCSGHGTKRCMNLDNIQLSCDQRINVLRKSKTRYEAGRASRKALTPVGSRSASFDALHA